MQLATTLLLLTLHGSQFEPPVTVRCHMDTELPVAEIRVTIAEMREREGVPEDDGAVTLPGLPAGDIHLSFFQREIFLGQIEIRSANEGEFIRLKVRLVTGNAILLDEFRVKGVSGDSRLATKSFSAATPLKDVKDVNDVNNVPSSTVSQTASAQKSKPQPQPQSSRTPPQSTGPAKTSSSKCPAPGDTVTRTGKLSRIIDNDSFELLGSDRRSYVVYVGSATRLKRGSALVAYSALGEGLAILVKGTIAAGPENDCSIGAQEVLVQRK